jgi:CheY-like chemotaxis protein
MGGKISAESELGKGSKFRFTLPLQPTQQKTSEQQQNVQLPPLTILIVDDIQQNIDLLSILLTRNGHTVLTARDGQQALIRMSSEPDINVVLMDVQMPVMDGLSSAKERRRIEQADNLPHIPIIALTASVLEDDKLAAQSAGMDGFANKPIDFQFLSHEIARVLELNLAEQPNDNLNGPFAEQASNALINESNGLALWGDKAEFYRQLNYFVKQQEDDFASLSDLAKNKSWQDLKNTSHRLKGICGNLSLTALMVTFESLELELNSLSVESDKKLNNLISSIQSLFQQVRERIDHQTDKSAPDLAKASLLDVDDLKKLLQQLKQEAQDNEVSEALLMQLFELLESKYSVEIDRIYNALNDFEFEQADQFIESLLLTIESDD